MSLVADYSDSSSSDSSNESDDDQIPNGETNKSNLSESTKKNQEPRLPSAKTILESNTKTKGMVFNNPFLEAEIAKTAALEKHVKMVNNDTHELQKNGRKICWNYRKGRCRFGTSCQYAHDSDLNEVVATPPGDTNTNTYVDANANARSAVKRSHPEPNNFSQHSKRLNKDNRIK